MMGSAFEARKLLASGDALLKIGQGCVLVRDSGPRRRLCEGVGQCEPVSVQNAASHSPCRKA
jgi:hypothetical protein